MSRNTAQISGQCKFGKLGGVTEKTDAAPLIKKLIFKPTSGRQMQSHLKRLAIFPLYLEVYTYIRMEILSVVMKSMGVFSCLTYISPSSHPSITRFQPYLRNEDINEVKTGVFRLKGQPFPRPLSSRLVGFTLNSSPFIHAPSGPTTQQRLWLIFNRKTQNGCQMFRSITDYL